MRRDTSEPGSTRTTYVTAAVSVALHVLVAGGLATFFDDEARAPVLAELEPPMKIPFAYACAVDTSGVFATRAAACMTPFYDRDSCLAEASRSLWSELILCEQQESDLPRLAEVQPAEIALIDPAALAAIKPQPIIPALLPKDPKELAAQEQKKIEEKLEEVRQQEKRALNGQIVEITQPKLESRPDKARFISEFDSRVEKETVARASTDKMVARPGGKEEKQETSETPKILQPQDQGTTGENVAAPGKAGKSGTAGLLAMRGKSAGMSQFEAFARGPLSGASIPGSDGGEGPRGRDGVSETGDGGEGGENGQGGSKIPNLRPSDDVLSKVVGGGSVDKLDGVEQGIETALNSQRWKYASFFNRMKRRVAQNWRPGQVYQRRDPTGRVYGSKDRLTVLKVSLSPVGELADVVVVEASGVDFLDREAIRAFRAAQPFPNPPRALVDPSTQLITFSFGFHFQIGGAGSSWWKFRSY